MRNKTWGGYGTIEGFVESKLTRFRAMDKNFDSMYDLMFSEKDNVFFEKSEGFMIKKTTYGEADEAISGMAAALTAMLPGLSYNDIVGLYMQNSLEWLECFWAILKAGFRPLLLNLRLDDEMLGKAVSDCSAKAVISDGRKFSVQTITIDDVLKKSGTTAADDGAQKKSGTTAADGGAQKKSGTTAAESSDKHDCGSEILVMSSGTSMHVKICAYTAEQFYYQILDSYDIIKECALIKKHYEGELKQLTFLPFYHVFGLIAVYIWFAFFSRTFVHLADMNPQTIITTIKRHKVTHIFAVPLFWNTVYKQAIKTIRDRGDKTWEKFNKGLKLSLKLGDMPVIAPLFRKKAFKEVRDNMFGESICFMITGGSHINRQVLEFFNGIGYHLADGYGMTEIGITSVELGNRLSVLNSASVGHPMSSIEYMINDEGELLVRGKAVASYILEDGRRKDNSDWFNTHDLAECEQGRYRILGRRDDLVVGPDGENINPNLVEPRLMCSSVREVCLLGMKDEAGESKPMLLVSVNPYISAERMNTIRATLLSRLEELNLSTRITKLVFTGDELMKGDEIKLNRVRLVREYSQGRISELSLQKDRQNGISDELMKHIRSAFAKALAREDNCPADNDDFFSDCGGTSLDYFAMTSQLQEQFSVRFPAEYGSGLNSIRAIYDFISTEINKDDQIL